ncbi:PREDICTED: putative nuclease HARBI1 [Rhagoletis zephyria]|uniref:putative nuclease HARBI1 n=1 Tax=Rhagoletis zephyria TaxID=28612 RepID=UPI00081181C7|nr:PREDICTED: putative nuclease HARBI1 [Rhagoletis zephyria]
MREVILVSMLGIIALYALLLLDEENEKRERRTRRARNARRQRLACLRIREDPFQMEESTFRRYFRLPKTLCWDIVQELKPYDKRTSKYGIPFELLFLSALHYLVNASYRRWVGNSPFSATNRLGVLRDINYICRLVVNHKREEISFPKSTDEYDSIKKGFHTKFGIEGVIGAIACTHVAIKTPASSVAHQYKDESGNYSIVVEAICDDELIIRHINTRFPGSCLGCEVWTSSPPRIKLINEHTSGETKWLLGDSEYPLEPWLLTPILDAKTENEEVYNTLHLEAIYTISKTFATLRSHFRCLSRGRVLWYDHKDAAQLVYACAIFHNVLQKCGIYKYDYVDVSTDDTTIEEICSNDSIKWDYYDEGKKARESYLNKLTLK